MLIKHWFLKKNPMKQISQIKYFIAYNDDE